MCDTEQYMKLQYITFFLDGYDWELAKASIEHNHRHTRTLSHS